MYGSCLLFDISSLGGPSSLAQDLVPSRLSLSQSAQGLAFAGSPSHLPVLDTLTQVQAYLPGCLPLALYFPR